MKSFEYASPRDLKEAVDLLGQSWGETEIMAGGTDLVTCLKQHLIEPKRVVSLKQISDLRGIHSGGKMVRIGAMTTLVELADDGAIKKNFPSLVSAVKGIGSPQIVNAGTVGGDLCQRPRCWYFRNGHGLLGRDGNTSLPREGDNRYHAIFGNTGPALFVSASSLGPALIALGATVTIMGARKREVPAAEFFRAPASENERETVLKPNEILTEIQIPVRNLENATYEVRHRHGFDWPYVTATVAYGKRGNGNPGARVVLGHVAPVPWVSEEAAKVLDAGAIDAATAAKCGEAAARGAQPLSGNGYKVQLVKVAVKRAVLAAAGIREG